MNLDLLGTKVNIMCVIAPSNPLKKMGNESTFAPFVKATVHTQVSLNAIYG
ncbi:hypothetical protein Cylst_5105 [Cylindrospermum stagnale PCC 7417]|uniref:Uncharacterized protein n=1 Tax=Cylindrospermum stagnale PCC 7417 TaxID=56107 RepID=K9X3D2_9NOST|nr:hypothetical protein Cylst_5105 [Cylindrospermum stagnale PCC 7417]